MTTRNRSLIWLTVLVVGIALLFVLRSILLPFVAGFAVAYLLDPANDKLESWGLSRFWATSILTAAFFVMALALVLVLVPVIYGQVLGLIEQIPAYITRLREAALPFLTALPKWLPFLDNPDTLWSTAGLVAQDYTAVLGSTIVHLLGGGVVVFNLVSLVLITPVVAFYLLRDWDNIVKRIDDLLPRRQRNMIAEQARAVDAVLAGFVRGQAMVSLALGVIYGVLLSLIGLDFGLAIGITAGLLSFIPYVGMAIGMIVAVGVAFLQFGFEILPLGLVVGTFLLGQAAESALLQPRLLGASVKLHPVWLIFGVLAGGTLFGFVGVLLAIPATAAIGVLVRSALDYYRQSRMYLGSSGEDESLGPT